MSIIEKDESSLQLPRHTNRRLKNVLIYKPIVVGTISMALGKKVQKDQLFLYCLSVGTQAKTSIGGAVM